MPVPDELLAHLDDADPGGVVGVYLYGSAVLGGLRPDSDVDLLVLTRRSLDDRERAGLVALLLGTSGWAGHAGRFPDAAHRRPVELTSLVVSDPPGTRDFQYGEWLRADLRRGDPPRPARDPDVVVLLASALDAHRALRGPALDAVVAPVSARALRAAVLAVVPDVLDGVEGDERNTLLTLARIVVTTRSGGIVAKDAAAAQIAPTLDDADRDLMERARAGYLGEAADDWTGLGERVTALARALAERARADTPGPSSRSSTPPPEA